MEKPWKPWNCILCPWKFYSQEGPTTRQLIIEGYLYAYISYVSLCASFIMPPKNLRNANRPKPTLATHINAKQRWSRFQEKMT
jgi:hypothetical protein